MALTRYCRVRSEVLWRLPENWRQGKPLGTRIEYPFTEPQLQVMLIELLEAEPLARLDLAGIHRAAADLQCDYPLACAADALIKAGQSGLGAGGISADNTEAIGFELLAQVAAAPATSPMLFYDELCGDLGIWYLRHDDAPAALAAFERAVAANLALQDGTSAASYLADLARAQLASDREAAFTTVAAVVEQAPDTMAALDLCALHAGEPVAAVAAARAARLVGQHAERYRDLRQPGAAPPLPEALGDRLLAALEGPARPRPPRDLVAGAVPALLDRPFTIDLPEVAVPLRPSARKIGRNEPCWCGSGKKYKKCHLGQE